MLLPGTPPQPLPHWPAAHHRCVFDNDLPRLERWIKAGADVNAGDYDARVPLHIAAGEGNLKAAKQLVEAGADVLAKDRFG